MSKLDTNIHPADTPSAASTRTTPALLTVPVTLDSRVLKLLLLLLRGPLPAVAVRAAAEPGQAALQPQFG